MTDDPAKPIVVRESPAKEISAQTVRVFLLGAFAMGAGYFIRSEMVLAAVVPVLTLVAGFVATYVVGLLKFLKDWRARLAMAKQLPDNVAKLK